MLYMDAIQGWPRYGNGTMIDSSVYVWMYMQHSDYYGNDLLMVSLMGPYGSV